MHPAAFKEGLEVFFFFSFFPKRWRKHLVIWELIFVRERSSSPAHCGVTVLCLDTINSSFEGSRWSCQQQLKNNFLKVLGFPGLSQIRKWDKNQLLKSCCVYLNTAEHGGWAASLKEALWAAWCCVPGLIKSIVWQQAWCSSHSMLWHIFSASVVPLSRIASLCLSVWRFC